MRVFCERADDTPLVALTLLARGGASLDGANLEGMAHHLAELAVRGAGERDRLGVDTELDRLGTSFSVNTSRDHLGYSATFLGRHLERVVSLLVDVLSAPRFEETEHAKLIRETRSDLEEIRDDDADLAARFFARYFQPGHPYARAIEGTEDSLERLAAIDSAGHRARYTELVGKGNLVIGFSGSIDDEAANRCAERLTKGLGAGQADAPEVPSGAPSGARVYLVEKPDRSQSQIVLGHRAPHYADPDGVGLLLVEAAFGGMFSSRLMQEVRVKRGWSYDVGIHMARAAVPSWIRMQLATNTPVTADALGLVIDLYRELVSDGLTADELDLARRYTIGSMLLSRATARQRVGQACIGAASGLADDFVTTLPDRLAKLNLADVNEAIARHLSAEALTIVCVGSAELAAPLQAFGRVEIVGYRSY